MKTNIAKPSAPARAVPTASVPKPTLPNPAVIQAQGRVTAARPSPQLPKPDAAGDQPQLAIPAEVARAARVAGPSWSRVAYVGIWMLLGVGSIAYITTALTAPSAVDRLANVLFPTDAETPKDDPRFAALASESEALKSALTSELTTIRSTLASLEKSLQESEQERVVVATRLKAIESGKPLSREDVSALQAEARNEIPAVYSPPLGAESDIEGSVIDGKTVSPKDKISEAPADVQPSQALAKPAKKKVVAETSEGSVEIVKAKAKPVEVTPQTFEENDVDVTGSIEPKKPAKEKPLFAVELANGPSAEILRNQWDLISQLHPDLLQELVPRAAKGATAGADLKLVAGPFSSVAKARAVCGKLAELDQPCRITGFRGDAL